MTSALLARGVALGFGERGDALCNLLPGGDSVRVTLQYERADPFGDMVRCLVAVNIEDLVCTGPELPVVEPRHRAGLPYATGIGDCANSDPT